MRFTTNRFLSKRFEFDEAKQYKKYLHPMCCVLATFYRERAGQQALAASVINHPAGRKVRHTSVQVSFTFIVFSSDWVLTIHADLVIDNTNNTNS